MLYKTLDMLKGAALWIWKNIAYVVALLLMGVSFYLGWFLCQHYDQNVIEVPVIEKVEVATGKTAYVLGTRTALRNFPMSQIGETVKDDYYDVGFSQRFNGTPCIRLKNYLDAAGNFVLSDTRVYVIAGDDKFIKHYIEGEPIVIARDATDNADLTQEYTVIRREGIAVVVSDTMGVYDFT